MFKCFSGWLKGACTLFGITLSIFFLSFLSADAASTEISSLSLDIDTQSAQFTVIDERMDETATAAVFFGLIGAAINSGANASADAERAKPMRETAENFDPKNSLEAALIETFRANGKIAVVPSGEKSSAAILNVELKQWGLRRKSRDTRVMLPFVEADIQLIPSGKRTPILEKRDTFVGKDARPLSEFQNDQKLLKKEIEHLFYDAGRSIAYQVIYR